MEEVYMSRVRIRMGCGARADRTGANDEAPDHADVIRGIVQGAGDGLLSRDLAAGVPSALSGLTIVFGMGTSVAPTL